MYSQAVKSQIDEEYSTEAPSSSLGKDEIKESNLSEKKKRSVARLQLQAISQLSPGVNKLTDKNAKQMKMEEKDREALLQFMPPVNTPLREPHPEISSPLSQSSKCIRKKIKGK